MSILPLCFVLMPFGTKPDGQGGQIDFDAVYREIIQPAIVRAGMAPLRADEELGGGFIHKPMFERLLLCDYALADLTTANANVYYELGIRHAMRPFSTVLIQAEGMRLPFDLAPTRCLPYHLDQAGKPLQAALDGEALTTRLNACRAGQVDSPLHQLLNDLPTPDIKRLKTDTFRQRVDYGEGLKRALEAARRTGDTRQREQALDEIARTLAPIEDAEAGVVIDLLLSYRAIKAWERMIDLAGRMSPPLAATVMVQEQLGFALNRAGRGEEAEAVLRQVIERHGPSSETLGLLGRVYKDRWEQAMAQGRGRLAKGLLEQAIATYLQGFENDWRDAYPGINALTLMELREPPDERRHGLHPVVAYAVARRLAGRTPDYWDHATLLELALLGGDQPGAAAALAAALTVVREVWEPETTLRNLRLIRQARQRRGVTLGWDEEIEADLNACMADLAS